MPLKPNQILAITGTSIFALILLIGFLGILITYLHNRRLVHDLETNQSLPEAEARIAMTMAGRVRRSQLDRDRDWDSGGEVEVEVEVEEGVVGTAMVGMRVKVPEMLDVARSPVGRAVGVMGKDGGDERGFVDVDLR
ncbi:MAG: hypothetical protein Q9186_007203 [Xanthomendoza sp. 1 TL-2023]